MEQYGHLTLIEYPGVLEQIDERFDNVSNVMTEGSVIYGSALTSVIAGLPADGDLDISVCSYEFMELAQNLANSTMWSQVDGPRIPENHGQRRPSGWRPSPGSVKFRNPYEDAPHLPVSSTVAFKNIRDALVQVAQSNTRHEGIDGALAVVGKVDMIFCGLAMDRYGHLIEAVPGSLQDCKDRRMRLNGIQDHFDPRRLKERIQKYAHRGWNLDIDVDGVIARWRRKPKPTASKKPSLKEYAEKALSFDRPPRKKKPLPKKKKAVPSGWDNGKSWGGVTTGRTSSAEVTAEHELKKMKMFSERYGMKPEDIDEAVERISSSFKLEGDAS